VPRHGWWVIVARSQTTAFRAKQRETLVPTLRQLQRSTPDAALKWFDRGRFWDSPTEAADALKAARDAPKRPVAWRPGGDHKDPRARHELTRDQKRARYKRLAIAKRQAPPGKKGS
jgi:hypothetical protein